MSMIALIVEDQRMLADMYRDALTKIADKVFVAHDLATAIKIIRSEAEIHLITLDLYLPDSTPTEVLSSIPMVHAKHPNCAIIILTGDESDTIRKDAIEHNPDGFVVKNDVATIPMLLRFIFTAYKKRAASNPAMKQQLDELAEKMAELKA